MYEDVHAVGRWTVLSARMGGVSFWDDVRFGVGQSVAAGLGMVPMGVAFGLLVVQSGLPWWMAPALSTFAYAGSLELLLIGLITAATPLATIALTTLLVNFRHVFYALSFPLHKVRGRFWKLYSMYSLTDEIYAVTAAKPEGWNSRRIIAMQVALQAYWVGGGLLGVLLSLVIPGQIKGLDFALCALFITLTLDAVKARSQVPSLLLGATCFALALLVVPGQALFAGMLAFMVVLAIRYAITIRVTRALPGEEADGV